MKLACGGCTWKVEAETADELLALMMTHGEEAHSDHFDRKSPEEIEERQQKMQLHVRKMIVDQN
jgi:predicted small metal-binding protein